MKLHLLCLALPLHASLPTRERGLKFTSRGIQERYFEVAPYTGAWIEIALFTPIFAASAVAPYTGAWIEIGKTQQMVFLFLSLPTRERGLKLPIRLLCTVGKTSLPTRERGLKFCLTGHPVIGIGSLPTRERGLKSQCFWARLNHRQSLPTRERGLKS